MAEVDSRKREDELLANAKLVDPDEALVPATKLGDHPAFLELRGWYSNRVLKTAYGITGKREDAEDAIQDAWMKAYLHLNTFDGRAKFFDLVHTHSDEFVADDFEGGVLTPGVLWRSRMATAGSFGILRIRSD